MSAPPFFIPPVGDWRHLRCSGWGGGRRNSPSFCRVKWRLWPLNVERAIFFLPKLTLFGTLAKSALLRLDCDHNIGHFLPKKAVFWHKNRHFWPQYVAKKLSFWPKWPFLCPLASLGNFHPHSPRPPPWNLLKRSETFWNLLKRSETFWNLLNLALLYYGD